MKISRPTPSLLDTLGRLAVVRARMGLRGGSLPNRQSSVRAIAESGLVGFDINNLGITSSVSLVSSLVAEDLIALDETSLVVLATVDEVGIVESKLNRTVRNVIGSLDAEHEAVILVAY